MTNKELQEKLKEFPDDMPVRYWGYDEWRLAETVFAEGDYCGEGPHILIG